MTGQIGSFGPRALVRQSDALGCQPGREMVFSADGVPRDCFTTVTIPATRPSLRFPLTEALAAKHGINLWYFDPVKWLERVPVDPAEYLGIPRAKS
jgi:hypothetical protein